MRLTSELFEAFFYCPTKCYLQSRGERGTGNTFAGWLTAQLGFQFDRQAAGSHEIWFNPATNRYIKWTRRKPLW